MVLFNNLRPKNGFKAGANRSTTNEFLRNKKLAWKQFKIQLNHHASTFPHKYHININFTPYYKAMTLQFQCFDVFLTCFT